MKQIYEEFVEKFKPKKTTDDCYTPEPIYNAVLNWVRRKVNIKDRPIIRPFYPNGDYEHHDYPKDCVVIDNPPFSIYSQIVRFYNESGIDYFLFCPSLTGIRPDTTFISCGAHVVYENGAIVNTSFVSSLFGDLLAITAPDLKADIDLIQKDKRNTKRSFIWPNNVVRISDLHAMTYAGIEFQITKDEGVIMSKVSDKTTSDFGASIVVSDTKAEKLKANKAKINERKIKVILNDKAKEAIYELNKKIL